MRVEKVGDWGRPLEVTDVGTSKPEVLTAGDSFNELFDPTQHRSTLVGIFLAILELVSHHQVRVQQNQLFGEIWILPNLDCTEPLDLSNVDSYDHAGE